MPPYWLGWIITWCCEKFARLRGAGQAPLFNFTRWKFMALNLDFSIEKAKCELGYAPAIGFDEGMKQTLEWFKQTGGTA